MPTNSDTAIKVATSGGTVVGQLGFGALADIVGRKKMVSELRTSNIWSYTHVATVWTRVDCHHLRNLGTVLDLGLSCCGYRWCYHFLACDHGHW
jgi:hypothetical protein